MSQTMKTTVSGYSGTPLYQKLGLKAGLKAWLQQAPANYLDLLGPNAASVDWQQSLSAEVLWAQVFHTRASELAAMLRLARQTLPDQAVLWVSWPKKASRQPTDITEDRIRELALPLGFVDVKVCAVDATWSGLKLMVRRSERAG